MKLRTVPAEYGKLGLQVTDPGQAIGKHFPDFMIIGPQRTGTTWLSEMLRRHPNVYLTRPKEPHYFNNLITTVRYKEVTKDFLWYLNLFDVPWSKRKKLWRECLHGRASSLHIVRGEATASTAVILTPAYIQFIYQLNPQIKIIYGLRNPIDRAWSHLKLVLVNQGGRRLEDISIDEMIEFCAKPYVQECGFNMKTIDKWLSLIPPEQFYCMRYAELSTHPEQVLAEVCRFLRVKAPSQELYQKLGHIGKINASEDIEMPQVLRTYLEKIYKDEIAWIGRQETMHQLS